MAVNLFDYPILYVDDERENLIALQYALDSRFNITTARSGAEALEIMKCKPIAVLLCDQRMPEMTGVELCQRALALQPEAQRMLLTAYSDVDVVISAINLGHVSRFLLKPWRVEDLMQVLESAIELIHLTRAVRMLEARLIEDRPQRASTMTSAEIIHEIANPLAALTMTMALTRESAERLSAVASEIGAARVSSEIATLTELHADLNAGVTQLDAMLKRLRAGNKRESVSGHSDLKVVIESAVRIVRHSLGPCTRVFADCPFGVELGVDASVMAEIAINLMMNANQAIERSGLEDRSIRVEGRREGAKVVLAVQDDGPGIDPAEIPELFIYRARGDGGQHLGLSIVRDLVQRAEGVIKVQSELGQGARFEITLPAEAGPRFLETAPAMRGA